MSITWHGVTVTFEVGWASNPSVAIASTSWTDESAYLRSISTDRGRSDELGTFQPGRASFLLDNRTRRFDPNYAAGPLYGNLQPTRRVRILLNTVAVWHGFVDDVPQAYDKSNRDATVTLNCTDGFAVLALLNLPESVYALEVAVDTPVAWYRLGELYGTIAADTSGNGHNGTYGGAPTTTGSLTFGGTDSAMQFQPQTLQADSEYVHLPAVLTNFGASIELWFQTTAADTPLLLIYDAAASTSSGELQIQIATGKISCSVSSSGGHEYLGSVTTNTYNNGLPHHLVAFFVNAVTAPTIYVDGVAQATTTTVTNPPLYWPVYGFGYIAAAFNFSLGLIDQGEATIDEVAFYVAELTAARVLAHYNAGTAPWYGELTGARVGKLLDLAGWPAADRTISTGNAALQSANLAGQKALGVLQGVEKSEQGQMFMGADGKVVYRQRRWRFEDTTAITSQATFGDDGTGVELPYWDLQTDGGAQFLRNRVVASRAGGALIEASDPASIAIYYERTDDELSELDNVSDDDVLYLAQWRVAARAAPIPRVTVLALRPRYNLAGYITTILGLDIGERVTIKRRPQAVGAAISIPMLVEGIHHSLSADSNWECDLYLSAFDSQAARQPLIFDDAVFGLFDTGVWAP